MKKITITNASTLSAKGNHNNKNCKPIICIDTGEVFTSGRDAAEYAGVAPNTMSYSCTNNGKCKGKRFIFVRDMAEHYEEIARHIREMHPFYVDASNQQAIEKAKANYTRRCSKYNKARDGLEKAREELLALGVTEL